MKTLINNNQRIFVITNSTGNTFAGNLEHISEIVKEYELKEGYFKIYEYFNGKPKRITGANLKRIFKANQINLDFFY